MPVGTKSSLVPCSLSSFEAVEFPLSPRKQDFWCLRQAVDLVKLHWMSIPTSPVIPLNFFSVSLKFSFVGFVLGIETLREL